MRIILLCAAGKKGNGLMKKLFKMIAGLGILAAIAGAIYYVYKNYLQDKEFDDLDDDDFDDYDDLDDEDSADSRGYVTLDIEPETEADESADSKVEPSDSEESETKEA